jgi:hypothetical protein
MMVYAFDRSILLIGVRIRDLMMDSLRGKKVVQFGNFTTTIHLDGFDFVIKLEFFISLELREYREYTIFASNMIKPSKFTKMINKNNIKACTIIR